MLIARRQSIADRACAAIEDVRASSIESALNLSPAASWMLARMEEDRAGVDAANFRFDTLRHSLPFFRLSDLTHRLIRQIHDAIGQDSTLTENGLIRLTPLGRLRIRMALNERIL